MSGEYVLPSPSFSYVGGNSSASFDVKSKRTCWLMLVLALFGVLCAIVEVTLPRPQWEVTECLRQLEIAFEAPHRPLRNNPATELCKVCMTVSTLLLGTPALAVSVVS